MRRAAAALRELAVWHLSLGLPLAVLAAVTDGILLAAAPVPLVLAGALSAAALAFVVAAPLAPLLSLPRLSSGPSKLGTGPRAAGEGWGGGLSATALAFLAAYLILDPRIRTAAQAYYLLCALTALAAAATTWLTRRASSWLRTLAGGALLLAATTFDFWLTGGFYPELHELAHLYAALGLIALATPLRRRLRRASPRRLLVGAAGSLAAALAVIAAADALAPGWRAASLAHARQAGRLARALRAAVDLDRDGFSPIAWGTDCDDLDGRRHPFAADPPGGGDGNCNGVDPPADADEGARGLAPAAGAPALAPGQVDRVLVVTVECLRADVLDPAVMPSLWTFASGAVRFTAAYSGGSRTRVSLGLIHGRAGDRLDLVDRLTAAGLPATAIVPTTPRVLANARGFPTVVRTPVDAAAVTDAALAALEAPGARGYFWVHYFDPHYPYHLHPELAPPLESPNRAYLSEVTYTDRHLARLLASPALAGQVVIVTGDHGTALGAHGVLSHGHSGYDEVLHVAAVAAAPGLGPAVYDQLVSHRDLSPTVLGAFALDPDERFGRSWLRLRAAPAAPLHTFVVSRSSRYVSGIQGDTALGVLIDPRHKLVASYEDHLLVLFDRTADPGETTDLAWTQPSTVDRLWRDLALYSDLDGYPRRREP